MKLFSLQMLLLSMMMMIIIIMDREVLDVLVPLSSDHYIAQPNRTAETSKINS